MNPLNSISSSSSFPIYTQQESPSTTITPSSFETVSTPQISSPYAPELEKKQVAAFIKLAKLDNKGRYSWTLEEVIIEKFFSHFKEFEGVSKEKLYLFFSVLSLLQQDVHDKETFKKYFLLFLDKKNLEGPMAALCILANCRSFFKSPMHVLLEENLNSNEQDSSWTDLYFCCFPYFEKLFQYLIEELKQLSETQTSTLQICKNMKLASLTKKKQKGVLLHNSEEGTIKSLSRSIKLLETHSKKLYISLKKVFVESPHLAFPQLNIYRNFLFTEFDGVIAGLNQLMKSVDKAINLQEQSSDIIISRLRYEKAALEVLTNRIVFLYKMRNKIFGFILNKIEQILPKSETPSWLFLDDLEIAEAKEASPKKKVVSAESQKTERGSQELFQILLQNNFEESFTSVIPTFSYLVSKELKGRLNSIIEEKSRPVETQIKGHKAVKEISDHLYYGALNFSLFLKLIFKGDFYGLKVVIPSLFLDLHLQVEQRIKFDLILRDGTYPATHSLLTLARKGNFGESPFFENFNYAMQQARYPFASQAVYLQSSQALKWIHYALNLADKTGPISFNDIGELEQFVAFVCKSYQDSLEIVSDATAIKDYLNKCTVKALETIKALKENTFSENHKKIHLPNAIQICSDKARELKLAKVTLEVRQSFDDASSHLEQIVASHYLQTHYPLPVLNPIYQRNQLIFQWIFEQLFVAQGLAKKIGDLRWIRHHDLAAYSYMVHSNDFSPHDSKLDQFNFGRTLHYHREKDSDTNLEAISNLLLALKTSRNYIKIKYLNRSKRAIAHPPLKTERINQVGATLVQELVRDALSYFQGV